MTHFPQPHPSRRAARVQLGDSVLAAIRLEDGRRTKAKLQSISVTGGLLQLSQSLGQGDFVEVAFQTQAGPVHGMAEVLSPTRKMSDGVLQPFRFVALEDEDHRRLRTSLDHVVDRKSARNEVQRILHVLRSELAFIGAFVHPAFGEGHSRYTGRVDGQIKAPDVRAKDPLREITTQSAEETIAFGRTLAELLSPPKLVLLRGDLGAGKTTLVKGIAAAFEAAAEEDVTSPTFTLVHEYRGPRANLYHIDLYRIDTLRELETLGLDDLRSENSILLIEWGEKFPRLRAGARCRDCAGTRERKRTEDQNQQLGLALSCGGRSQD